MLAYSATALVGSVFLLTGIAKALRSRQFVSHVLGYGLLPPSVLAPLAIGFIALECALGVALILHSFPRWLIPATGLLLLCLTALSLWAAHSGRLEQCACYRGLVTLSPGQSALLNLGYGVLLALAWVYPAVGHRTTSWHWLLVALVMPTAAVLAWRSRDRALLEPFLKIGKPWRRHWLRDSSRDLGKGAHLVAFMHKDCAACKQAVPFLKILATQKDLPDVLGVMPSSDDELDRYKADFKLRFPLAAVDKRLFPYLVDSMPTFVLIDDGVITGKWTGQLPGEYLARVRQCYDRFIAATKG